MAMLVRVLRKGMIRGFVKLGGGALEGKRCPARRAPSPATARVLLLNTTRLSLLLAIMGYVNVDILGIDDQGRGIVVKALGARNKRDGARRIKIRTRK